MSKTVSKFALAASISLAMAFTFSCTSDGGDEGGGGGVPEPTTNANGDQTYKISGAQVYEAVTIPVPKYTNRAPIDVVFWNSSFRAGTIEGGKLSLDLTSIPNFNADDVSDVVFTVNGCELDLLGSTRGLTQMTRETYRDDMKAVAFFSYASESGQPFNTPVGSIDLPKKGWNLVYFTMAENKLASTEPSGLIWEWMVDCDED